MDDARAKEVQRSRGDKWAKGQGRPVASERVTRWKSVQPKERCGEISARLRVPPEEKEIGRLEAVTVTTVA